MRRVAIAVLLSLTLAPAAVGAATISLTATLDCSQANAGAGTCGAGGTGTGSAAITLDTGTNLLSWNVTWSGLSSGVTVAHFHGPALPNQNAGVQVGITPASPSIGSTIISAVQASDLLAGLWYLNIHSAAFPGGEIRGQVTAAIPEPNAALLFGAGSIVVGASLRRRR